MTTIRKIGYLFDLKYKLYTVLVLIVITVGSLAELLGVSIVLPIVNLALDAEEVSNNTFCRLITRVTGKTEANDVLIILLILTIAIYIIKNVYLIWMNFVINRYSTSVRRNIAMKLLNSYMRQPYSYFQHKNTAEIVRSINSDTTNFNSAINNILYAVSYGLTSIGLVLYLCKTSIQMTLAVTAVLAVCALLILGLIQKRVKRLGKENQRLGAEIIKYVEEAFLGIKEVKVMNRESYFVDVCEDVYTQVAEISRKSTILQVSPKYMIEAFAVIGILLYMMVQVNVNDNFASIVPQLSIFAIAAMKLLPSVNAVYAYINAVIFHKASLDLVYEDVKECEKLPMGFLSNEKADKLEFNNEILVEEIEFSYDNEKKVLDNVNLSIKKGTSIAFIGSSGGGKTTLADIILGILKPQKGRVLVDGQDVSLCERSWHETIGYIPQSIFMLDDSIKRNVAFGMDNNEIDEDKLIMALKKAQLWEFVSNLKDGVDTMIGERGTRLSGGQRQRIGIARALYHDPDVLIFDEATSALDNATEQEVMKAIDGLRGEKTILMIAHRLSTIENCDHVYKVENCKLEQVR